ncbi:type I restriction enzyme HsdR N-terminal domain-containing protein [Flavobacteriales bacterium]|nr:type I restriction enzyme HsdR N-terminal domain-containing protein [Flavobacteriales bacterium]
MDDNKFNFKVITKKDKKYIYDITRKKYILLTDEEKVRQLTIRFLIDELQIPKSQISTEKEFKIESGLKKRFDIIVFNRNGKVAILVECKSSKIKINTKVIDQILIYNKKLKAKYLMVTNGIKTIALHCAPKNIKQINNMPKYLSL